MRVVMPSTVEEACAALAERALVPFAGGTDLMVHWPVRPAEETRDKEYLDLSGIGALRAMRWRDTELMLGGLTTYWDVIQDARARTEFPLLQRAARQVGAIQIQSRGTWAGNIVNGSPAADGVPVLMAYDATVELMSTRGAESVALDEFYLGYKQMRRKPDQLVTAIRLPRRKYDFAHFEKVGARRAQTITKVGVAITHSSAGWRVVANSVAPMVLRCRTVEGMLESGGGLKSADEVMTALRADVAPIDDIRSTAVYRLRVLGNLIFHAVRG